MDMIREFLPEIAILDIEMSGLNGLSVCQNTITEKLKTKVLFLTVHNDYTLFSNALKHGACGYLSKNSDFSEIELAIKKIINGEFYLGVDIKKPEAERFDSFETSLTISTLILKLTCSEKNILHLISKQKTSKEIAADLNISESTVKNHRHNIIGKLNLSKEQNSLLRFAINNAKYF